MIREVIQQVEGKQKFVVAISTGNGGWNNGGSYDKRQDAIKQQMDLISQGFKTKVVFEVPWNGTINLD